MARRGGGILMAIARDIARQQRRSEVALRRAVREQEAERNRFVREAERQQRQHERSAAASAREQAKLLKEIEREEKARYLKDREDEAAALDTEAAERLEALNAILAHTLSVNDALNFEDLRVKEPPPVLSQTTHLSPSNPPARDDFFAGIDAPTGLRSLVPGAKKRHIDAIREATQSYDEAVERWRREENKKADQLNQIATDHAAALGAYELKKAQRDAELDDFKSAYYSGESDAIISYCTMVLESSDYPDDIPRRFSLAYTQHSRQLVVEMELPTAEIIPVETEYRYVKSTDRITARTRKDAEIREIYQNVIASIALRTIHELIEADRAYHIGALCFNGYVHTVDPATGRDIQPHLISVRTTPEKFEQIDLARVDKRICLKNLGAQVSSRPDEAQPVRPIVEFDMADARFVDQTDLVSGLSSSTNLMALTPFEFEQLVANLFGQMGLESKLTRSSRDGGVDCVAYDARPVLGGKVVIQAKRYRHTVGVSAVRDLFGTMLNEGANKGILVTTSGYGPDAFDFAKDKPIELIDGGGLLYLLQQEAGLNARIVVED